MTSTPPPESSQPVDESQPVPQAAQPAANAAGDPFAPVPRGPKVVWINPARRRHVIGASVLGALIALGVGLGVGAAVGGGDHGDEVGGRFDHGDGEGHFPMLPYLVRPGGYGQLPPGMVVPTAVVPTAVVPSASTSVSVSPSPAGSSTTK